MHLDVLRLTQFFHFGRDKLGHIICYKYSENSKTAYDVFPNKDYELSVFYLNVRFFLDPFSEVVNACSNASFCIFHQ